jgi:diguanylate cyclase (GGDEF)-like protein
LVARTIEWLRTIGASIDGSILDEDTWRSRHGYVVLCGAALTLFTIGFSIADTDRPQEWFYVAAAVASLALAWPPRWPRRAHEVAVAVCFMAAQLYVARFVGNFTLGPLLMIVMSFYQDWVPMAVGCLEVAGLVVAGWVDPGFLSGSAAFARENPAVGMSLRGAAILLAAGLALAVWRSGTQLARDQLTGLLSRLGVERIIDREIARGRRPAVWVCDLDNFGAVNRQLGARTGDLLLRHVAHRLRAAARSLPGGSRAGRLGGDKFLIVHCNSGDADAVERFAHRIEDVVGTSVRGLADHDIPVRLSIGAALATPGEAAADLVREAERHMRAAKGRGTVRVVVDRSSERIVEEDRALLSSELYRACERGELTLHIQPIVELADGRPVGGETLARWNHPRRGLLHPIDFLPEAERDSALMAAISNELGDLFHRLVADFARRQGPEWLPYGLSYNLAAMRLRDPTITATLTEDFARTGLVGTAGRVNVEVTEGALMEIENEVPEVLAAFRAAGYCLALDDFGIGHSSLAHLRDLPLDTVKLDKSFIHTMDRSAIDRAVVEAVVDIASVSGMTVIAEGVETEEQRDLLVAINPEILGQGWLYARAMPPEQFEAWVLERGRGAAVA